MARLNELPAPATESLESIKRRFIRQNREIARVNSNQSMRIRNLETEISRLLTENIAIREDAINAKVEADKWKAAHRLTKDVVCMKERLEEKLQEVNALVTELGTLPEKATRRSSQRRRREGLTSGLLKTGEERDQRSRQTILDQDGRLPAILEDKSYPRQTLEPNDLQPLPYETATDAIESPDLGPPPVAHFEEQDAVAFNPARSPRRTSTELIEETEKQNKPAASTTENRRKRRTSILLQSSDIDPSPSVLPDMPESHIRDMAITPTSRQITSILKIGAKRKLEVSELEDTNKISKELDDFIFQRKGSSSTTQSRPSRFSRPPARVGQENTEQSRSPQRLSQPARKILAPKSTNSPAKRRVGASFDKISHDPSAEPESNREKRIVSRVRSRPADIQIPSQQEPSAPPSIETVSQASEEEIHLPPKTPAAELDDIISPVSTEPSNKQRQLMEMAVTNSLEDVLNGSIGRPSRRARAPINYAQPKLNTKMRRPGKELVGAVEGITRKAGDAENVSDQAGDMSTDIEHVDLPHDGQTANLKDIQQDITKDGEQKQIRWQGLSVDSAHNSEPASPLKDKKAPVTRKSGLDESELGNAASTFSVFDPPSSSPVPTEHGGDTAGSSIVGHSSRVRRHSMQMQQQPNDSEPLPTPGVLRSRRHNSTVELSEIKHTAASKISGSTTGHSRKSASVSSLPSTGQLKSKGLVGNNFAPVSHSTTLDSEDEGIQRSRNSALTRRRSMMV